jgi:hypothetical protein
MTIELSPQIEAELRAESTAQEIPVAEIVAKALGVYLQESKSFSGARRVPRDERTEEMAWAANPDSLYVGQWVVLEGRHVVASDSNARHAYDAALSRGIVSPFPIYVPGEGQETRKDSRLIQ